MIGTEIPKASSRRRSGHIVSVIVDLPMLALPRGEPSRKEGFSLSRDALHDLTCCWQVVNKATCFARDHSSDIEVALIASFFVAPGLFSLVLPKFTFAP